MYSVVTKGVTMLTEKQRERFFAKITKQEDGCWMWTGYRGRGGYGQFVVNRVNMKAHRVSFIQHKGEIPEGLLICHTCDTPGCVNPEHLFAGTCKDNMDDMRAKGRDRQADQKGAKNNASKLTEEDVLKVVELLPTRNNKQISEDLQHRVSHSMVSRIRLGKSWAGVTGINSDKAVRYRPLTHKR